MKTLFSLSLLLLSISVFGQTKSSVRASFEERNDSMNNLSPEDEKEKPVIQVKEKPEQHEDAHLYYYYNRAPEFPGGFKALKKFIKTNFSYPQGDSSLEGKIALTFWVLEDGSITDIQVIRSSEKRLDQSVIDLIKKMPKWLPANDGIRNMRLKYTLSISFPLSKDRNRL